METTQGFQTVRTFRRSPRRDPESPPTSPTKQRRLGGECQIPIRRWPAGSPPPVRLCSPRSSLYPRQGDVDSRTSHEPLSPIGASTQSNVRSSHCAFGSYARRSNSPPSPVSEAWVPGATTHILYPRTIPAFPASASPARRSNSPPSPASEAWVPATEQFAPSRRRRHRRTSWRLPPGPVPGDVGASISSSEPGPEPPAIAPDVPRPSPTRKPKARPHRRSRGVPEGASGQGNEGKEDQNTYWNLAVAVGILPVLFVVWLATNLVFPKLVAWSPSSPERFAACGQLEAIDDLIDGLQPMPGITHFVRSFVCDSTQFVRAVHSLNRQMRNFTTERVHLYGDCLRTSETMREAVLSIPDGRHHLLLDDADRYVNMCNRMTDSIDVKKDRLKEQLGSLEEQVAGSVGSFGNMGQTLRGIFMSSQNLGDIVDEYSGTFSKFAVRVRDHVNQACSELVPQGHLRSSAEWVDWCDQANAKLVGSIDDNARGIRKFNTAVHNFREEAEEFEKLIQGIKQ